MSEVEKLVVSFDGEATKLFKLLDKVEDRIDKLGTGRSVSVSSSDAKVANSRVAQAKKEAKEIVEAVEEVKKGSTSSSGFTPEDIARNKQAGIEQAKLLAEGQKVVAEKIRAEEEEAEKAADEAFIARAFKKYDDEQRIKREAQARADSGIVDKPKISRDKQSELDKDAKTILAGLITEEERHAEIQTRLAELVTHTNLSQEQANEILAESVERLPEVVAFRKQQAEATKEAAIQEAKIEKLNRANESATDKHTRRVQELNEMFDEGTLTQRAYLAEVEKSRQMLPEVSEETQAVADAQKELSEAEADAASIIQSLVTKEERRLQVQIKLQEHVNAGRITQEQANDSLEEHDNEVKKSNSLSGQMQGQISSLALNFASFGTVVALGTELLKTWAQDALGTAPAILEANRKGVEALNKQMESNTKMLIDNIDARDQAGSMEQIEHSLAAARDEVDRLEKSVRKQDQAIMKAQSSLKGYAQEWLKMMTGGTVDFTAGPQADVDNDRKTLEQAKKSAEELQKVRDDLWGQGQLDRIKKYNDSLALQAATLGMTSGEARIYKMEQDAITEGLKKEKAAEIALAKVRLYKLEADKALIAIGKSQDAKLTALKDELELGKQEAENKRVLLELEKKLQMTGMSEADIKIRLDRVKTMQDEIWANEKLLALKKQMQTPEEKFLKTIAEIDKLRKAMPENEELYGRAVKKAREELWAAQQAARDAKVAMMQIFDNDAIKKGSAEFNKLMAEAKADMLDDSKHRGKELPEDQRRREEEEKQRSEDAAKKEKTDKEKLAAANRTADAAEALANNEPLVVKPIGLV